MKKKQTNASTRSTRACSPTDSKELQSSVEECARNLSNLLFGAEGMVLRQNGTTVPCKFKLDGFIDVFPIVPVDTVELPFPDEVIQIKISDVTFYAQVVAVSRGKLLLYVKPFIRNLLVGMLEQRESA